MKDIGKLIYRVFEKTGEPGLYMLYKALEDGENHHKE